MGVGSRTVLFKGLHFAVIARIVLRLPDLLILRTHARICAGAGALMGGAAPQTCRTSWSGIICASIRRHEGTQHRATTCDDSVLRSAYRPGGIQWCCQMQSQTASLPNLDSTSWSRKPHRLALVFRPVLVLLRRGRLGRELVIVGVPHALAAPPAAASRGLRAAATPPASAPLTGLRARLALRATIHG